MNLRELHPFYRWWVESSGWHSQECGGELLAEGNLAAAAWNAALDAAAKCVGDDCVPANARDRIAALGYVSKEAAGN